MRGGEVVSVRRIEAVRVIGDNVGGRSRERYRTREIDLLPAARGFVGKRASLVWV
jgi:hypothetical protein